MYNQHNVIKLKFQTIFHFFQLYLINQKMFYETGKKYSEEPFFYSRSPKSRKFRVNSDFYSNLLQTLNKICIRLKYDY